MATTAESKHMERVASLGCIACRRINIPDTPAEIHHLRSGQGMSQRSSHFRVIPLCPQHHRLGKDAFHMSQATFQRKFGSEEFLLEIVEALLEKGYA